MVEFVNVSLGTEPIIASFPVSRVMCIIGKTANDVGVLREIQAADLQGTLTGTNGGELLSTDNLYKAAEEYFSEYPGGTLTLGGVSASGTNHYYSLFDDISSTVWRSKYSPLDGTTTVLDTDNPDVTSGGDRAAINDIEILLNSDGVAEINADTNYGSEPEGQWYVISDTLVADNTTTADRLSVEEEDGIYTGKIEFTGPNISITPDGSNSVDITATNIVSVRASVATSSISETVAALLEPGIQFDGFAFAYDSTKEGDTATDSKYDAAECAGGIGWLHDVILGSKIATQFNANQQRAMFYFGLPEKVLPTDDISDDMAVGTDYVAAGAEGTIKYDALRGVLGQNLYVSGFVTKQTFGSSAVDPSVVAMAKLASNPYRDPLTFSPSTTIGTSIDDAPSTAEFKLWKQSRINTYVYSKSDDAWQWGSSLTFGASGNSSKIQFVRCKNRFAIDLQVALNTIIKRKLKYDVSGYDAIRKTIAATQRQDTGVYIDGPGEIVIPNESLIRREGDLDTGEQAALEVLRATEKIDGVSVGFDWNGNIEYINVTSIHAE